MSPEKDAVVDITIAVMAYMHESVIDDLLESIISQKTSYVYEILIGVDFCSDKTAQKARNFEEKYPIVTSVIEHEHNIGAMQNCYDLVQRAKGRYLLIHDGDDIFMPEKLNKMCDFLEKNSDCVLVAHPMILSNSSISKFYGLDRTNLPAKFDLEYLVSNYIALGSSQKMFRMPVLMPKVDFLIDFGLDILHVRKKKIGFINEPLGIKRDYDLSITKSQGLALRTLIDATLNAFDLSLPFLENKYPASKAKERYLIGSLLNFVISGESENYTFFSKQFNDNPTSTFWISTFFRKFRKYPKIQRYLFYIAGIIHHFVRKQSRNETYEDLEALTRKHISKDI